MGCFSRKEIKDAAALRADAEARLADISARSTTATTPAQHVALGREQARALGDWKSAGFVLTEDTPTA
ncbi:hypothetical protein [Streptomyces sp. Ag109_O5-10]|uniref:hypothetical protein n=1 Tax=Streptomyces sp. Ag109_O5-10 TaxID=1855349 RepID=UPI000898C3AA|nr:hypothetical protein [Streptomyces sp. Ag109_O5-10]SEF18995.1 hypothetical protein SAMN05216533_8543 [Streptomyces sp. Ag109_O5-10]